jgi:hypothetical protein
MPLREYHARAACEETAWGYNVEHVWDGPQGVLPKLKGELKCLPDWASPQAGDLQSFMAYGKWSTRELHADPAMTPESFGPLTPWQEQEHVTGLDE